MSSPRSIGCNGLNPSAPPRERVSLGGDHVDAALAATHCAPGPALLGDFDHDAAQALRHTALAFDDFDDVVKEHDTAVG